MRGLVQKRIAKLLRRFPISLICAGFLPPAVSTSFDKHASESIHAHRRNSSIIPGDWAEQQQRVLRDSVTLDSYISSPYVRSLKTFPFQSILSSVTRLGAPRATVAVDFQPWTLGIPSGMFVDIVHDPIPQRVLDRVIGASRLATSTTLKPCKGAAPLAKWCVRIEYKVDVNVIGILMNRINALVYPAKLKRNYRSNHICLIWTYLFITIK